MQHLLEQIEYAAVVSAEDDWQAIANLRAIRAWCAEQAEQLVEQLMPALFEQAGQGA